MRIELSEVANRFSDLLERAERGEEIIIAGDGKSTARLISIEGTHDRSQAQASADRLRALARELNLGPPDWAEWRGFRDEGRG